MDLEDAVAAAASSKKTIERLLRKPQWVKFGKRSAKKISKGISILIFGDFLSLPLVTHFTIVNLFMDSRSALIFTFEVINL